MEMEGRTALSRTIPAEQVSFRRYADMRYRKQGHEIRVPIPGGVLSPSRCEEIKTNFTQVYVSLYGHTVPETPIDVVSWRVVAQGPKPDVNLPRSKAGASRDANSARKGMRPIFLPKQRDTAETPVYDRYALVSGTTLQGPAIIEERESTVVVNGPGNIMVDEYRNLIVDLPQWG
jgi:N-methylhydantoinase A